MSSAPKPSFESKVLAARSCGRAIIEVRNLNEASFAEAAGARCVLLATPSPAGGRCFSYNNLIRQIMNHLSVSVMARVRSGHTHEAEALESMGCQFLFLDQSDLFNAVYEYNSLNMHKLGIPCVCSCRNLDEALKSVKEGAGMIRIHGEPRSCDIGKTVTNVTSLMSYARFLQDTEADRLCQRSLGTGVSRYSHEETKRSLRTGAPPDLEEETNRRKPSDSQEEKTKRLPGTGAPSDPEEEIKRLGRLPVPTFAVGGILTVDDAKLFMELGCDGVFVGSEIFDTEHPYLEIRSIIRGLESCRNGGTGESTAEK